MAEWMDQIVAFIERNQALAPWIMLIFAAAETTAFLSILVPSTAVMVGVGALAATGAINFLPLWIGASIGALIGSSFSYWLGHRYGDAILKMRPLSDHPDWVAKANASFTRWGPVAILIGHFTTVLRPVVFLLAGMNHMSLWRFAVWNGIGCLAWAWVVPKFGEVGGMVIGWIWGLFTGA